MIEINQRWYFPEPPVLFPASPPPSLPSMMGEGIAGAGAIRTAMRVYAVGHGGQYPGYNDAKGDALGEIRIKATDLTGRYFGPADYSVTTRAGRYTVTARFGDETFIINERGEELGTFKTGKPR